MKLISALPEILSWSGEAETVEQVHEQYIHAVGDALSAVIATVHHESATGRRLLAELREADSSALLRVLLAPGSTNRLLWGSRAQLEDTAEFLLRSLSAEAVLRGRGQVESRTWTALGDAVVDPPANARRGPRLESGIPLDCESPNVSRFDPHGDNANLWHPLSGAERDQALDRLTAALRGITSASDQVNRFVRQSIKVLVLQTDHHKRSFAAYSNGHFIGQCVLSNPQLVDDVQVAEAVVHESIHAFLYMQSQQYPWGITIPPADHEPAVVSPWSQRQLPVSTYIHACFVWYGLLHFWSMALAMECFPVRRVRGRMARAASGFLGAPLLDRVDREWVNSLADEVRHAICELQRRVVESYSSASSMF